MKQEQTSFASVSPQLLESSQLKNNKNEMESKDNNKKMNNSKKKIKIKDDNQLLGAIYNSLVRNDTDNEGHVCLLEEVGFFLNYSKNTESQVSRYDKLEPGILIPSNVYIQHKRVGCITEWYV